MRSVGVGVHCKKSLVRYGVLSHMLGSAGSVVRVGWKWHGSEGDVPGANVCAVLRADASPPCTEAKIQVNCC